MNIAPVSNSTFIAIGNIYLPSQYTYEGLYATKFDSSGNLYWSKNYLSDTLYSRKIVKSNSNKFAITGGQGEATGKLCLIDSLGNLLLKKFYYYDSTAIIDYDYIQNCSDSGFIISGYYSNYLLNYKDFLVLKTDKNFNFNMVGIENSYSHLPENDIVVSTYPNPFNPEINIKIELRKKRNLSIKIYNIEGRELKSIFNINSEIGTTLIKINTYELNLCSGIYFIKVSASDHSTINKIILLK